MLSQPHQPLPPPNFPNRQPPTSEITVLHHPTSLNQNGKKWTKNRDSFRNLCRFEHSNDGIIPYLPDNHPRSLIHPCLLSFGLICSTPASSSLLRLRFSYSTVKISSKGTTLFSSSWLVFFWQKFVFFLFFLPLLTSLFCQQLWIVCRHQQRKLSVNINWYEYTASWYSVCIDDFPPAWLNRILGIWYPIGSVRFCDDMADTYQNWAIFQPMLMSN